MKAYIIVFATLLLTLQIACKKTTMVHGVIADGATGKPLEGVDVLLQADKHTSDDFMVIDKATVKTDENGSYGLEIEGKKVDYIFFRIEKQGYFTPPNYYPDNGKKIEYNRNIQPFDAYLSIKFINQLGIDNLYCGIKGAFYEGGGATVAGKNNPISLSSGDSLTKVIKVLGGEFISIHWDNKAPNNGIPENGMIDSVFCARNDTTFFTLYY